LEWGQGLWQEVQKIQEVRKGYVHRFLDERDLFPNAGVADKAIEIVRNAIVAIYAHVGRGAPPWVQDDEDRGWDSGPGWWASATVVHKGASTDDPHAIRVCYLWNGQEHVHDVLPAGTDPQPYWEDLLTHLNVPASAIRVYEGDTLLFERPLPMRGS
jgi:hypothetical protein